MPRKKNPNNNYFNEAVEQAVCAYLSTDNQIEREKHFKIIYPALCKISEVWWHKLKFSQSDDTMEDDMAGCVAWLVEKMDKFKCGKGTKAFSYYTVTAKFYYMQLSNKNYKYFKNNLAISELGDGWDVENSDREDEVMSENSKLYHGFLQYCEHNFDKIFNPRYKKYSMAVLDILTNFEQIQDFRRRKVLKVIFTKYNMSEPDKAIVTKQINTMVAHFNLFKKRWESGNESLELCTKRHLTTDEKRIVKASIVKGKPNNGSVALARQFGVDVKVVLEYLKTI